MTTRTLSPKSLSVIDQYLHFKFGRAVCGVPYFNNKTVKARAQLRANIGKGSPKDILEEVQFIAVRHHIDANILSDESLKKLLLDNNLGIECSGFAYYVLDALSNEQGKGALDKHIHFVNAEGFIGKLRAKLRPVENCDVSTFADDFNSKIISLNEILPGDFITMTNDVEESERDHILIIHAVSYENDKPTLINYSHAVAYPEDGLYNTGVKQGTIAIIADGQNLTDCLWSESGSSIKAERIFNRAKKSRTELRRLKWGQPPFIY